MKPKAPLTVHLRAGIQKRSRRNPPPRPTHETKDPQHGMFQGLPLHNWFCIPEDDVVKNDKKVPQPLEEPTLDLKDKTKDEGKVEEGNSQLIEILQTLAEEFEQNNRPYCAMAARHAIVLTQKGEEDDINPGLWQFIRKMEQKRKDNVDKLS